MIGPEHDVVRNYCERVVTPTRVPVAFAVQQAAKGTADAVHAVEEFANGRTFAVINHNHKRAVVDGVNVGYDVYRIKTRVTEQGGKVEKGFRVDHRNKASRAARQAVLADDFDHAPADLDRSVVVPDQIRTVLQA